MIINYMTAKLWIVRVLSKYILIFFFFERISLIWNQNGGWPSVFFNANFANRACYTIIIKISHYFRERYRSWP